MATIRFIYGFLCLIGLLGYWLPDRHLLKQQAAAAKLLAVAQSQLGVRESSPNKGQAVMRYLNYVQLKQPAPWCAAFVSWVYGKAGYSEPRTAWSPALFPKSRQTLHPERGDVLGIYFTDLKRIAHCGLVERLHHDWVISIEGNTNVSGGREGDGVYRKWRHRRSIRTFARWLPEKP